MIILADKIRSCIPDDLTGSCSQLGPFLLSKLTGHIYIVPGEIRSGWLVWFPLGAVTTNLYIQLKCLIIYESNGLLYVVLIRVDIYNIYSREHLMRRLICIADTQGSISCKDWRVICFLFRLKQILKTAFNNSSYSR